MCTTNTIASTADQLGSTACVARIPEASRSQSLCDRFLHLCGIVLLLGIDLVDLLIAPIIL